MDILPLHPLMRVKESSICGRGKQDGVIASGEESCWKR